MTDDLIELLQTLDARLYRDTLLRRYFEEQAHLISSVGYEGCAT